MATSEEMMTIGRKLVDLCNAGKDSEALETLYAEDAVSAEAVDMPGMGAEARGKEAIRAKGEWWYNTHEMHSATADGPYVYGDRFNVIFEMDVTNKESGERTQMKEVATYHVADGKIVREEFAYPLS